LRVNSIGTTWGILRSHWLVVAHGRVPLCGVSHWGILRSHGLVVAHRGVSLLLLGGVGHDWGSAALEVARAVGKRVWVHTC